MEISGAMLSVVRERRGACYFGQSAEIGANNGKLKAATMVLGRISYCPFSCTGKPANFVNDALLFMSRERIDGYVAIVSENKRRYFLTSMLSWFSTP